MNETNDVRERMQECAGAITTILPPFTGFALLAFDFKPGGRMEYVSNAQRPDILRAMREFIAKSSAQYPAHVTDVQHENRETRLVEAIEKWMPSLDEMARQIIAPQRNVFSKMVEDFQKALK